MKTYQDGEIYFIRELDYSSGKPTSFVKIGLVRYKENRNSFGRLMEHQTGNPRKLDLENKHIVKTQAVDLLEAQLHRQFSQQRISGEWFEFGNDAEIESAVKIAQSLAKEVSKRLPRFQKAENLMLKESNKDSRPATDEERELARTLLISKTKMSLCKELSDQSKQLLTKAYSEGADISDAAKTSVKTYKPAFLEDKFKEVHGDLWEKYQGEVRKWMHTFLNKYKLAEGDLGEEFEAEIERIKSVLKLVESTGDYGLLVEVNLTLTNLNGLAEWDAKLSEAELKIKLDLWDGIDGVCTWKRYEDVKMKFDSERFAAENPELALKFVSTPVVKTYVVPKKGKTQ